MPATALRPSAAAHTAEPEEAEDPRNALLDALDEMVDALVRNGLEVQVRARLERIWPAPAVKAAIPVRDARLAGIDDLDIAVAAEVCRRLGRYKLQAIEPEAIKRLSAVLIALLPPPETPASASEPRAQ